MGIRFKIRKLFGRIKERVIYWLRKLNIIKMDRLYVKFDFLDKVDYNVSYSFHYIISGNNVLECHQQFGNILAFLNQNFLMVTSDHQFSILDEEKFKDYENIIITESQAVRKQVPLELYQAPNFHFDYIYSVPNIKIMHSIKITPVNYRKPDILLQVFGLGQGVNLTTHNINNDPDFRFEFLVP